MSEIIQTVSHYQIPVITLDKETPKEAVCQVFENVNQGGVSLTVFELVTAVFAMDDFELRPDWENRKYKKRGCAKDKHTPVSFLPESDQKSSLI